MKIDAEKVSRLSMLLSSYAESHGRVEYSSPKPPGCASKCGMTCLGSCYGVGIIATSG